MRSSDWSSDVCSSDLASAAALTIRRWNRPTRRGVVCCRVHRRRFMFRPDKTNGYRVAFHADEVNHCPGCGGTQWLVGRLVAECAFCAAAVPLRSEEHTSELQSLMRISYAVFCLKKKKTKQQTK